MTWWGWMVLGAVLFGAELFAVDAQFFLVFLGLSAAIVGLAEVAREKYLDATDEKGKAVCVDLRFVDTFETPVHLGALRKMPKMKDMPLVRISRLSVMPVGDAHWRTILDLSKKG